MINRRGKIMGKLFAIALLAATPLLAMGSTMPMALAEESHEGSHDEATEHGFFGFFYTTASDTIGSLDAVSFDPTVAVDTKNIFLDPNDSTEVVLRHRGSYVASYIVSGHDAATGATAYRFALELDDTSLIPGSVYGVNQDSATGTTGIEQLCGQVVFTTTHDFSTISLVNDTIDPVSLEPISGGLVGEPASVTASLVVAKLKT